jgi:hypothetical protein
MWFSIVAIDGAASLQSAVIRSRCLQIAGSGRKARFHFNWQIGTLLLWAVASMSRLRTSSLRLVGPEPSVALTYLSVFGRDRFIIRSRKASSRVALRKIVTGDQEMILSDSKCIF